MRAFVCVLLLLAPGVAQAKVAWHFETSGTKDDLESVWGRSADDVWVVGGHAVLRSLDRGATWVPRTLSVHALHAVSGHVDDVWIVGDAGTVLRSHDGGASFATVAFPTTISLTAVATTGTEIYVVDGFTLFVSRDDGKSWSTKPAYRPMHVHVASPDDVWIGGDTQLHRSVDRGVTFTATNSPAYVWEAFAVGGSSARLWTVGAAGVVAESTDHGVTWKRRRKQDGRGFYAVWSSGDAVFAAGDGIVARDVKGAFVDERPETEAYQALFGTSADQLWAVGGGGRIAHRRK
ncbi:MAG: WD40/YVTN/BNR-like repeat-containing protein [Polyangiales bacterium]